MGRLLTKATWGILPRAAFAFSDECCGAAAAVAAIDGGCCCDWRRLTARLVRPLAPRLRAGASRAITAGAGGLCGCVVATNEQKDIYE